MKIMPSFFNAIALHKHAIIYQFISKPQPHNP